jgi:hypothetical protein
MAALAPLGSDAVPHAGRDQQKTASTKYSSSYEVAHPAFSSIIDPSQPVRVVAERDYAFAHEAPVYLEKLNKVSRQQQGTVCAQSLLQLQACERCGTRMQTGGRLAVKRCSIFTMCLMLSTCSCSQCLLLFHLACFSSEQV